jgi:hypothetical protein
VPQTSAISTIVRPQPAAGAVAGGQLDARDHRQVRRQQAALQRVGQVPEVGLGPQPGEELPDLAARAGQHVDQLLRHRPPRTGEQLAHTEQLVAPEHREGDRGPQRVRPDGVAAEEACVGPQVADDDRGPCLPDQAGQPLAAHEGAQAGVGLQGGHRLALP